MQEAGYSHGARLSLDREFVRFVNEFERMRDAKKEVAAKKPSRKPRQTEWVPVYSKEELLRFLDIDPTDTEMVQAVAPAAISQSDWDAVPDWGEDVPAVSDEGG
jgi:hypothetical protein